MMARKGRVWSGHGDGLPGWGGVGGGSCVMFLASHPGLCALASLLAPLICNAQLGGSSFCSLIGGLPSVINNVILHCHGSF